MHKSQVVRRFQELVDEMEHGRVWGKIEVSFQNGQAETIRKEATEKLNRGATHDQRHFR
jgi:hypothetical protein